MKKYIYPAIFHPEEVGGYSISFPDLDGCFTEGDNLQDSYEMAQKALGGYISCLEDYNKPIPNYSEPVNIKTEGKDFIALIEIDMLQYRRENSVKLVKKTLNIPQWLNIKAEREGINFSNVLQKALKEALFH